LSVDAAPLTGLNYTTDAKKVHQIIHGLVQGEIAETWIKPTERRQNGRVAFLALQSHYGGEGNKSVCVKEAEGLRKNRMCKSERTMSFELFLTKMQTMFIGFLDSQEVIEPPQQIRLLFDKVQCPGLETVKNSLQVAHDLDNATLSLTVLVLKHRSWRILSLTAKQAAWESWRRPSASKRSRR
jgi:hypothetical protein